jgi:hypothetical protein
MLQHNFLLGGYCDWLIENALHRVLDACFREDDQRHWAGNSAQKLGWLRKLALCLLKAERDSKGKSIATRRLLAGWKDDDLLSVLAQVPEKSDAEALGIDPARRTRPDHDVLRGSPGTRPVREASRRSHPLTFVSSFITAHRVSSGASVERA